MNTPYTPEQRLRLEFEDKISWGSFESKDEDERASCIRMYDEALAEISRLQSEVKLAGRLLIESAQPLALVFHDPKDVTPSAYGVYFRRDITGTLRVAAGRGRDFTGTRAVLLEDDLLRAFESHLKQKGAGVPESQEEPQ